MELSEGSPIRPSGRNINKETADWCVSHPISWPTTTPSTLLRVVRYRETKPIFLLSPPACSSQDLLSQSLLNMLGSLLLPGEGGECRSHCRDDFNGDWGGNHFSLPLRNPPPIQRDLLPLQMNIQRQVLPLKVKTIIWAWGTPSTTQGSLLCAYFLGRLPILLLTPPHTASCSSGSLLSYFLLLLILLHHHPVPQMPRVVCQSDWEYMRVCVFVFIGHQNSGNTLRRKRKNFKRRFFLKTWETVE